MSFVRRIAAAGALVGIFSAFRICRSRSAILLILIVFVTTSAEIARACAFHLQLPEKTVGDYILESSLVVLAREDVEKQSALQTIATLKGQDTRAEIDVTLPSTTRQSLTNNPDDTVLLARSRDDGSWRKLAYVRSDLRPFYEQMVESSKTWVGSAGPDARFRFYADFHDHPDRLIRQLALTELDRAAYRDLREMQIRVSAESLERELWAPLEQQWTPIRILMIGILGDADSKALVTETIASAEASTWSVNLGAWATAFIEIEGAAGIDRLQSSFLVSTKGLQEQIEAVLTALAVHGAGGDPNISDAINSALSAAINKRPDLAVTIARIFGAQRDYSRADLLSETLKQRQLKSPADIISVATYVSLATQLNKRSTDRSGLKTQLK